MSGPDRDGPGLKGLAASVSWTDEAARWSSGAAFHTFGRAMGKSAAAMQAQAHIYVDSLTDWQRSMMDELLGSQRRFGETAGRLTEILGEGLGRLADGLVIGGGLGWSSVESKAWAWERVPGVERDEREVREFWDAESARPGTPTVFGRGGRPASPVASPRMRRARLDDRTYAWVPDGLPEDRCRSEARRRPRQAVPGPVLAAEERLRMADRAALEWVALVERLGHGGEVKRPYENGGDWECSSCGAVTSDEELFGEMRCGGA